MGASKKEMAEAIRMQKEADAKLKSLLNDLDRKQNKSKNQNSTPRRRTF